MGILKTSNPQVNNPPDWYLYKDRDDEPTIIEIHPPAAEMPGVKDYRGIGIGMVELGIGYVYLPPFVEAIHGHLPNLRPQPQLQNAYMQTINRINTAVLTQDAKPYAVLWFAGMDFGQAFIIDELYETEDEARSTWEQIIDRISVGELGGIKLDGQTDELLEPLKEGTQLLIMRYPAPMEWVGGTISPN